MDNFYVTILILRFCLENLTHAKCVLLAISQGNGTLISLTKNLLIYTSSHSEEITERKQQGATENYIMRSFTKYY
jgi:hypothetical protein